MKTYKGKRLQIHFTSHHDGDLVIFQVTENTRTIWYAGVRWGSDYCTKKPVEGKSYIVYHGWYYEIVYQSIGHSKLHLEK